METHLEAEIQFEFTERAKEYLAKQGIQEITIKPVEINSCCIPVVAPPEVHRGGPKNLRDYQTYDWEGLRINYYSALAHPPKVSIDTQGFGFMKGLKITNWEIRF